MTQLSPRLAPRAGEVRQRILEGAARAFAAQGFQGTSVPRIAAEAGVSVGLLYRYFPSKADLFASTCSQEMETAIAMVGGALAGISNPAKRLRRGLELYLRHVESGGAAGLVLSGMAESRGDPAVRQVMQLRRAAVHQFIAARITESVEAGELPGSVPVGQFTRAITLMLDGAVADWAVSGGRMDRSLGDAIVALLSAAMPPLPAKGS